LSFLYKDGSAYEVEFTTLDRGTAAVVTVESSDVRPVILTAQRPGEVRGMRWADVDFTSGWWSMAGALTKNAKRHRVPKTAKSVEILKVRLERAKEDAVYCSRIGRAPDLSRIAARKPPRHCRKL
jgi:integrase